MKELTSRRPSLWIIRSIGTQTERRVLTDECVAGVRSRRIQSARDARPNSGGDGVMRDFRVVDAARWSRSCRTSSSVNRWSNRMICSSCPTTLTSARCTARTVRRGTFRVRRWRLSTGGRPLRSVPRVAPMATDAFTRLRGPPDFMTDAKRLRPCFSSPS
jgi:hypothetical protein